MKRFICVMLTLIMLVSLVPATALTASAATRKTGEAAITVLKNMMTFRNECYQIEGTNEYRIGYGTPCTKSHKDGKPHTIRQEPADKALREQLVSLDKKVNSFASGSKLSLNQGEFDALSVFSYLYGTAWMSGNGILKTAILKDVGANELLNAMYTVSGSESRSKILVNMYINGVYSNNVPGNYETVTYDAGEGHIAQGDGKTYTMYFDADEEMDHVVTATRYGYKFMGWYNAAGKYYSNVRVSCAGETLYAHWQNNNTNSANVNEAKDQPAVNYVIYESQLASSTIYDRPSRNGEKIGDVDGTIKVDMEYLASDGARWAKIAGKKQWVRVTGGADSSDSGSSNTKTVGVTITNSYVNIRKDATIRSALKGTFQQGEKVYIIKTKNADGFLWGEVAKSQYDPDYGIGWIALMYTNWNSVKDNPSNVVDTDPDNSAKGDEIAKATITFNGYVNLRSGAGTGNKIVGSLAKNETVNVYEIKTVNGHQWGRTNSGWFCMTYASVTMLKGSSDVSNEGSQAYTFTGTAKEGIVVYEEATLNSNKTDYQPKADQKVSIITLKSSDNQTWAKIGWKETIDKKSVTKYGWVRIENKARTEMEGLSAYSTPVSLHSVTFQVVANEVTVRKNSGSGAKAVTKLNKDYQFDVAMIKPVGEEIWGAVENIRDEDNNVVSGWVNLASKYVKRADQIKDESESSGSSTSGKIATIVNTDTVNVRADSFATAKLVGTLRRGATANVIKERDGWYKLDVDVDNDPETSSWVFGNYVQLSSGSSGSGSGSTKGIGIVANTYAGVNVRQGAGTGSALVGKLLPGTQVEILETKYVGSSKWGRIDKGWVCMDYISMLSEMPSAPEEGPSNPADGSIVGDLDDVEKTTTTAVYTGTVNTDVTVWASTDHDEDEAIKSLSAGDPVTIYELITVTEKVESGADENGNTTETVTTSYWARVNDGYIRNPDQCIDLDALDEVTHTLTGSNTLNVRAKATVDSNSIGKLEKGDKVDVTKLKIEKDKVWGRIEFEGRNGWIRLDYMAEGAFTEQKETVPPVQPPKAPVIGDNGNTGDGGFVNNGSGYRYTGKVINTNSVNVRATASTTASITTTLSSGQSLVVYETTTSEGMAWGRCDAGWVYLYYVDLTPCIEGAVDARVVYQDNTIIYSDVNMSETVGTYSKMSVIDIYEIIGKMARTDLGWVNTDNLL